MAQSATLYAPTQSVGAIEFASNSRNHLSAIALLHACVIGANEFAGYDAGSQHIALWFPCSYVGTFLWSLCDHVAQSATLYAPTQSVGAIDWGE